jgi:hypothetical protein
MPLSPVPAPAALAVVPLLLAGAAPAATLTVGPGQPQTTIAAAVAAAHNGDTIAVLAGVYVNDFAEIAVQVTLTAVGGQVILRATGNIANGKGILITDTDTTITGFGFIGAHVTNADGGNGAGLRYQGGNLVLNDCYFANNQDGLLADADATGTITIANTEFYHNGVGNPADAGYGLTHNLYVGAVAVLDIENSYSHAAIVGHEIKSRALTTIVRNSRVVDGPTGTASYSIDLPNGGVATIENDQIEQGPLSQNPIVISFGEEGGLHPGSTLTVRNTLIENDLAGGDGLAVKNATDVAVTLAGTRVYGLGSGQLLAGPGTVTGTTVLTAEPTISGRHPWLAP